jgi:hypothetical protein
MRWTKAQPWKGSDRGASGKTRLRTCQDRVEEIELGIADEASVAAKTA